MFTFTHFEIQLNGTLFAVHIIAKSRHRCCNSINCAALQTSDTLQLYVIFKMCLADSHIRLSAAGTAAAAMSSACRFPYAGI